MVSTTAKIRQVIQKHKVINLAYVDKKEVVQSCALWYASDDDLHIYYLSSLTTHHGDNLKEGGQVAFTINKDNQDWRNIVGVQGRGHTECLAANENAWDIYTEKFPFVLKQFSDLQEALSETKLWKITPTWIRLIDNRVEFGHKEEIDL